jgi:hypothetical protein
MLTPEERRLRAQVAAHAQHAQHDPHETTVAARAALRRKYAQQVDPAGTLRPEERDRRVRSAMRADLVRLQFEATKARRLAREAADAAFTDALLAAGSAS